jgi:hypothetical protein
MKIPFRVGDRLRITCLGDFDETRDWLSIDNHYIGEEVVVTKIEQNGRIRISPYIANYEYDYRHFELIKQPLIPLTNTKLRSLIKQLKGALDDEG